MQPLVQSLTADAVIGEIQLVESLLTHNIGFALAGPIGLVTCRIAINGTIEIAVAGTASKWIRRLQVEISEFTLVTAAPLDVRLALTLTSCLQENHRTTQTNELTCAFREVFC